MEEGRGIMCNPLLSFLSSDEGMALKIGGALYFFIFITCGAFICSNLLVAVVTTNLEQSVAAYNEERQSQSLARSEAAYAGLDVSLRDWERKPRWDIRGNPASFPME